MSMWMLRLMLMLKSKGVGGSVRTNLVSIVGRRVQNSLYLYLGLLQQIAGILVLDLLVS